MSTVMLFGAMADEDSRSDVSLHLKRFIFTAEQFLQYPLGFSSCSRLLLH